MTHHFLVRFAKNKPQRQLLVPTLGFLYPLSVEIRGQGVVQAIQKDIRENRP